MAIKIQGEDHFSRWMVSILRKDADVIRVESNIGRGIPDLNVCHKGRDFWVELKLLHSGRVLLRPEQYAWGHRRAIHGGHVFISAMDIKSCNILIWKFPKIEAEPYSKYVWVRSMPHGFFCVEQNVNDIKSFLFTS